MTTIEQPTKADIERIRDFGKHLQEMMSRPMPQIVSIEGKAFMNSIKFDVNTLALKCQAFEGV